MFELKLLNNTITLLRLASKFFAVKLDISDEEYAIISVDVCKRLRGAGGNCYGHYVDDKLTSVQIRLLSHATDSGMIEALAHEMVHAKQHLKGEFWFATKTVPFLKFWKVEQKVQVHGGQILHETPYYERKCEQEAFIKSRELTRQFLNFVHIVDTHGVPN